MRILYFHQHFSTPRGSLGTRSYEMARRLIARGHTVTMVCGSANLGDTGLEVLFERGSRRGTVDGIRIIEFQLPYAGRDRFLKRTMLFLKFAARSVGVVLSEKVDLVFATSTPLTAAIPGIVARWIRRRPFVFEVRDLWPELPRAMGVIRNPIVLGLMGALEWVAYHSAKRCIALSPGIVEGIARHGYPREKIALVPNACDLDMFAPRSGACRRERLRRQVAPDAFVAVFAGAHGVANGLDAVLDAAAVLKARGRAGIHILLVGDGQLKPHLAARVESECLPVSLWDPLEKSDLALLFAEVDAGLMVLADVPAFYFGTSPNKFFDYIASGLPVLNNYPGWIANLISEHECGVVVPPGDPEAFANALELMADNSEQVRQMGANARRLAEERFSREGLAQEFVSVLESAHEHWHRPPGTNTETRVRH